MKLNKSTLANIFLGLFWLLALTPLIYDMHISNEEMTRKAEYVKTHPCKIVDQTLRHSYFDWRTNEVKIEESSIKYKCDDLDSLIVIRQN